LREKTFLLISISQGVVLLPPAGTSFFYNCTFRQTNEPLKQEVNITVDGQAHNKQSTTLDFISPPLTLHSFIGRFSLPIVC
jgi:hypothetical protein